MLSGQIQEQRRANDLKEQEIIILRRRDANTRLVLARYANLGELVSGLVISVNQLILELHGQVEQFGELAERIERIDKSLLILMANGSQTRREAIMTSLGHGPEVASLKRRITQSHRRLQKLQEQQARQGADTPPAILTEIEDLEATIAEMENELNALR